MKYVALVAGVFLWLLVLPGIAAGFLCAVLRAGFELGVYAFCCLDDAYARHWGRDRG